MALNLAGWPTWVLVDLGAWYRSIWVLAPVDLGCQNFRLHSASLHPLLQVVSRMLDGGCDPQAALDAPRFCIDGVDSSAGPASVPAARVLLEEGIEQADAERLRALGHNVVCSVSGEARAIFGRGQVRRARRLAVVGAMAARSTVGPEDDGGWQAGCTVLLRTDPVPAMAPIFQPDCHAVCVCVFLHTAFLSR